MAESQHRDRPGRDGISSRRGPPRVSRCDVPCFPSCARLAQRHEKEAESAICRPNPGSPAKRFIWGPCVDATGGDRRPHHAARVFPRREHRRRHDVTRRAGRLGRSRARPAPRASPRRRERARDCARCRVGARRILRSRSQGARACHRAPPRDGRARAGQDPGGAHRERRVHAVHGVPLAVGPEQPAGHHQERRPAKYVPYLATSPTRDETREGCRWNVSMAFFPDEPNDARRASLRTRPPRIAFSTAPHAATRAFRAPRRTAHARAHRADP